MSPASLVFHTIATVKLISKMLLEQTHPFYIKQMFYFKKVQLKVHVFSEFFYPVVHKDPET